MSLTRVVPRVWLIVGVLLAVLGVTQTGVAADSTYTVNRFEVAWKRVSADLPPSGDLQQAEVTLGRTPRGYTGKVRGKPAVRTDVAALGRQGVVRVDAKALDAIAAAIQKKVEAGGLLGVTVQAFLEQTSKGKTPRYTAWFLAEAPLPDLVANTRIPLDLTDLNEQAVPAPLAVVPDAPIPIESSSAPSPTTVPLAAESPVVAEAPVDVKDAVEPAVARVTPTIDAPPVIEDPVETVASAPSVETEVVVESTAAETHAATERPVEVETVPTTVAPVPATAAAPPAVKPKPHKPSRRPPPIIEGVSVRWAGGSDVRGDPTTLFRLTTLRLRMVDGEMQAGWGDVGIVTSMYGDLLFPDVAWRRPWLPSATREVLHAIVDRLKELGMDETRVTKAFETEDGHSRLVFTLHPPPRGADLPPLVTQNETVDGNFYYAVWPFDVMYSLDHSELPPASSFEHLPIKLGRDEVGFTSVGEGDSIQVTLGQLNDAGTMLYSPTALIAINRAIMMYLVNQDLEGVFVLPWNKQIVSVGEEAGEDLRMGKTELTLLVTVGRVSEVQTSAWGDRIAEEDRINNPAHQGIAEGSPLAADGAEGDLVRYQDVMDYMYFLSRHPGRDVRLAASLTTTGDVAEDLQTGGPIKWHTRTASDDVEPPVATAAQSDAEPPVAPPTLIDVEPPVATAAQSDAESPVAPPTLIDVEPPVAAEGDQNDVMPDRFPDVTLDYQISEVKPWMVWYQWGNTGTKAEGYQRQQFGFYTSQLTGNDDIFMVRYATSDLSGTNSLVGNYEAPLGMDGRLRWGVSGSWSQYFADQYGVLPIPDAYTGFSWSGGGELRLNVYQEGPLFVDVVGGGRLQHLGIENNVFLFPQQEMSFAIPYGMVQMDREGEWSSVRGSIGMEGNVFSHDDASLENIGHASSRGNLSNLWARLNWAGSLSTYLEPLFNYDAWSDAETPKSSTLAHEVYLGASGQFAFGSRLMPQFQSVSGGPGTNRGYPVSVAAGDNAVNFTGEYRYHVPRGFAVQDPPGTLFGQPFRYAPQRIRGRADWDLMLLGFVDYSWLTKNSRTASEYDQTLLSAGVGLEFQFKRNLRVRVDWGWALRSLEDGLYDSGHDRLYVQASLSF